MTSALARKNDVASSLVSGEFAFSDADFKAIAQLLYSMAGIALPDSKATLVYSRLAKRLRSLGLKTFGEYCDLVASSEGEDERLMMLAALTTNVTRFFREPHHFEHLQSQVIEPLAASVRAGRRLRIWSAGCSTGQEPYSIALTILKVIPEAHRLDVKILATDIDPNVIRTARAATYPQDLVDEIPPAMRGSWMERSDGGWTMSASVRGMVTANELNLMNDWPMRGSFDAIFCRNVVIYFDEATQARMWSRFAPRLSPGGRLYVGHSERAAYAGSKLETDGLTTYRAPGVLA